MPAPLPAAVVTDLGEVEIADIPRSCLGHVRAFCGENPRLLCVRRTDTPFGRRKLFRELGELPRFVIGHENRPVASCVRNPRFSTLQSGQLWCGPSRWQNGRMYRRGFGTSNLGRVFFDVTIARDVTRVTRAKRDKPPKPFWLYCLPVPEHARAGRDTFVHAARPHGVVRYSSSTCARGRRSPSSAPARNELGDSSASRR
jgi:hypothetical protein